jgi:hypothetical protein
MDDRPLNSHQVMESKTQFDLNRNLELWRQSLAQSPSFQPDNLDELEVHLRDSVNTLEDKGLSTEEAFLIAVRRVGQPTDLDTEFGKVNSESVWLSRLLWMAVGIFVFSCAQSPVPLVLFAVPTILLRRLALRNQKPRNQFIARTILNRPIVSMAGLAVLGICLTILSGVGNAFVWHIFTMAQINLTDRVTLWRFWTIAVAQVVLLPIAVVYLYRRQLKAHLTQA